ncbi:inorganic phosphate transporter [Brachybacterium huguangmaarense]
MLTSTLVIVTIVIITALAFDFTNGFHDSANAMATSVATGALKPRVAVLIAAVLNVAGAFMSTEVAKTISSGMVDDTLVTPVMVFAGLSGAILWNLLTWLLGMPSSSSHALFGGLIGAVLVSAGVAGIHPDVIVSKILLPALAAPIIAGIAAAVATRLAYRIAPKAESGSAGIFRHGQTISASLVALAHGTSDGQKTMGIITLVLVAGGFQASGTGPQMWVIIAAGFAIGLGTYSGGWRIMRTLGKGLVDIKAPQGFAAETATTAAILASSHLGFGLSTTHVASGSIMGSGVGRDASAVRWGVAGRMVITWLVTLPAAALVGAAAAAITMLGTVGVGLALALLIAGVVTVMVIASRNKVTADNVHDHHEVAVTSSPAAPSHA